EHAHFLAGGCDAVVAKPVNIDTLMEAMARHITMDLSYQTAAPDYHETDSALSLPSPKRLAVYPVETIRAMQQAASIADMEETLRLIETLRDRDHKLADALATLAHNFRFDRIIGLSEAALVLIDLDVWGRAGST
ncbi:MAG: hypothetical protein GYB64_07335, partial [Chloroflexi bacterium]|nr:hypothetical protein [Chloroflexota bacterium]